MQRSLQRYRQPASVCQIVRCSRRTAAAQAAMGDEGIVTAAWLKERLGQPGLKVLDASWYMPVQARDGLAEFKAKRIPGAKFFDVDKISDPNTDLPHMLPTNAGFSAAMDALGITADDTVFVYDGMGMFSAPRAWWTFKVFGHDKVYVLEGGLPAWQSIGGDVETSSVPDDVIAAPATKARQACQQPSASTGSYPASLNLSKVRNWQQMLDNISAAGGRQEQVVDARSVGRFIGTEPEPRPGLIGGHIPGARNVPFPTVLEPGGKFKSADQLSETFTKAGIDLNQPVVGSCGSGLTACILALAIYKATGAQQLIPVYDGSWSEWGARQGLPVSTEAP